MKVKISQKGVMSIVAENDIESFALSEWMKKNVKETTNCEAVITSICFVPGHFIDSETSIHNG